MNQKINFKNKPGLMFLALLWSTLGWSQSGTLGNTYVFGGGQATVHGGNFSFLTGGSGVLPGIVGTDRSMPAGYLGFMAGTTWSDASDAAHVDGYVKSYQTGKFTFPIGDNGQYNPVAVSAASLSAPADAAYYAVDPGVAITSSLKGGDEPRLPTGEIFSTTSKDVGINRVSTVGYWDINGDTAAKITLSWNTSTNLAMLTASDLSSLKIVGWDGIKWVEIPATVDATSLFGESSTLNSGSITTIATVVPNAYTVYTLAAGITDGCSAPVASAAWNASDCDHDGLTNGKEIELGTDPYNPDTDGDGVLDGTEVTDGTDPKDGCSYQLRHVTLPPSPEWNAQDCDGDGLTNGEEITRGTDPQKPDTDGDGVIDGTEVNDGTDSLNICDSKQEHVTVPQSPEYANRDCNEGGEIKVFNALTPNGDGINDVLIIKGLENYPNNHIEIFNRWGVKVYETDKYGENGNYFTGISEGRATIKEASGLPTGTYFYVLKCSDNKGNRKEKSGYLYLNR